MGAKKVHLCYFVGMENVSRQIFDAIGAAKRILLISHVNPDGDTLGCACAMKLFIGEKADILVQTRPGQEIPEIYEFLPNIKEAKTLRNVQEGLYDLVIALDVASIERMVLAGRKIFETAHSGANTMTINIDHHKTNPRFAKINLIDEKTSSCGEVLVDLFSEGNVEITKDMADCLYVALMTDTGGFRYENTTPKTLDIASALIKRGAHCADLAAKVYDSKSKAMVMFQAFCVSNTVFLEDDKIAYTIIRNADMASFKAKHEHTEGIAETIRSIKTVEVAIVIKENELPAAGGQATKVSLRTKSVDAIKITEKFNGGGHIRSAGCTINKPVDIATRLLLERVKEVMGC